MNSKDISAQAEKYRQEMMKLYSKSENPRAEMITENDGLPQVSETQAKENSQEANENSAEENKVAEVEQIAQESNATQNYAINTVENMQKDEENLQIDERFPEPDISEFTEKNEQDSQLSFYTKKAENDAMGYIRVVARSGDNAFPVKNALAIVTYAEEGQMIFKTSALTDESGQTEIIKAPAPNARYSLNSGSDVRPYSLYNITLIADGYFRERSVDVPVFAGITSVQQFNLVPLPLYMGESAETIEVYNQEPQL